MAQEPTVMAHLVPKLTNQVEDAATDALAFILNKSAGCRRALDRLLRDENFEIEPISRVETQVTYEDGSRPDMVGYDRRGGKRLLVEAKFWAVLQQDQASRYFARLDQDRPAVLLFIAPESRIETLWSEIRRQMESGKAGVQLMVLEPAEHARKATILDSKHRLMLVSWTRLLNRMATSVASDPTLTSDINQLRGLAEFQDEEAFLPVRRQEFDLTFPRRIRGLNRLIDDAIGARGVPEGWLSITGFRMTPKREGYGRYFAFTGATGDLFLGINYKLWATSGETPLWLRIGSKVPINREKLRQMDPSLDNYISPGAFAIPIHIQTGVEYKSVVDHVVKQIRQIADSID
ncbi:MAG: hypothetical protein OXQ32_06665 [bacterium]|nr:hypothetical protein [bacterium]